MFLVFFDQIAKYFIPRDFLVKNYALPFGLDFGKANYLILIFAGVLLSAYFVKSTKSQKKLPIGFVLVGAGVISNLIDRIVFGYVRDFVNLGIITINFADLFIIGGLFMLLFRHERSFRN